MSAEGKGTVRGNWIARLWRFLWRPNMSIAVIVLLFGGFVGGILFWGGLHWAVELSNTEKFCISCHEMRENPYVEMQDTIHFVNRTGARAICSDCHVPRLWVYKMKRKIEATGELYHHVMGKVDTPEKYEAHRLNMALSVWDSMKQTDSRECRNCHSEVWMNMDAQFGGARRNHQFAIDNDLTCIDCHQGITHRLPEGFEKPTNEQLAEDSLDWIDRMKAMAETQTGG